MALQKVGQDSRFLDMRYPNFDLQVTSIAYLVRARTGYTKGDFSRPYLMLYLRDFTGNLVTGWIFDIPADSDAMVSVMSMSRRPVEISYKIRENNGSYSLYVEPRIKVYTGEDFPYDNFLGKIEQSEELFRTANLFIQKHLGPNVSLPLELETEPFLQLCAGRQGGFAKFSWSVCRSLASYINVPTIDAKTLVETAYRCLVVYADHLRATEDLQITLPNHLYSVVHEHSNKGENVQTQNILADALGSILGLGKSEHLYSKIVTRVMMESKDLLDMCYTYPMMVEGSKRKLEDGTWLAKY